MYYFNRLACHSVYAAKLTEKLACVVANDTDVFILLLHLSINCNETLYFRQRTTSSRDVTTYDNVTSLSSQLGEKICAILPVFHWLTSSDFKKPFFGRSKINSFKKMIFKPEYGFNVIHEYWPWWHRESNVFCVTCNLQLSKTRNVTWRYGKDEKRKFAPTK